MTFYAIYTAQAVASAVWVKQENLRPDRSVAAVTDIFYNRTVHRPVQIKTFIAKQVFCTPFANLAAGTVVIGRQFNKSCLGMVFLFVKLCPEFIFELLPMGLIPKPPGDSVDSICKFFYYSVIFHND